MSSNQNPPEIVDRKTLLWNRVQLILVLVVFAAPIAGAFLYKPTAFNNYGDLYTPVREVEDLQIKSAEGLVGLHSFRRQWLFLVVASEQCSEACEDNILKMRQLRFMQNDDMKRIRTVFLHSNLPDELSADLAAKYSPVEVYSAEPAELEAWSEVLKLDNAPAEAQVDRFYIIDPTGNLMMSYPPSADPSMMKKDIKRLLKTSQIG